MTKQVVASPPTDLWVVILAGEDGTGLQARAPGSQRDDPNKLLRAATGYDSLLRRTLTRARLAVPLERTVIVANRSHEVHLAPEFPVPGGPRLLLRPRHRGTAADVVLAVHWIRRQEPNAIVAILPSEQLVLEPFAFAQHVVKVARFVERNDREIVIVGARPTYPDTQYGWIETGERIAGAGCEPVWRVRSLQGSQSYPLARACYESGSLWNTFVTVARAETLLQAGRRRFPELDTRLETVATLIETPFEQRSLDHFYAIAAEATFSEAVLAGAAPQQLSASRLPPIYWSARANTALGPRASEPRGRFDGPVDDNSQQANVEACREKKASSPDSPLRAAPREPVRSQSARRRVAAAWRRWNGEPFSAERRISWREHRRRESEVSGSRLDPAKDGSGPPEHPTVPATSASHDPERGNDRPDARAVLPGQ